MKNELKNDFAYFYGNDGLVNITNRDNKVRIKYDQKSLPYLWIFQTRGGWNNLNVNVIEPCTAGLKDIEEAYDNNLLYIPENNIFKTWYEIEVYEKINTSIVIRCLNENDNLKILIPILQKQTLEEYEIIFVDSGSTDGTLDTIKDFIKSTNNVYLTHIKRRVYLWEVFKYWF